MIYFKDKRMLIIVCLLLEHLSGLNAARSNQPLAGSLNFNAVPSLDSTGTSVNKKIQIQPEFTYGTVSYFKHVGNNPATNWFTHADISNNNFQPLRDALGTPMTGAFEDVNRRFSLLNKNVKEQVLLREIVVTETNFELLDNIKIKIDPTTFIEKHLYENRNKAFSGDKNSVESILASMNVQMKNQMDRRHANSVVLLDAKEFKDAKDILVKLAQDLQSNTQNVFAVKKAEILTYKMYEQYDPRNTNKRDAWSRVKDAGRMPINGVPITPEYKLSIVKKAKPKENFFHGLLTTDRLLMFQKAPPPGNPGGRAPYGSFYVMAAKDKTIVDIAPYYKSTSVLDLKQVEFKLHWETHQFVVDGDILRGNRNEMGDIAQQKMLPLIGPSTVSFCKSNRRRRSINVIRNGRHKRDAPCSPTTSERLRAKPASKEKVDRKAKKANDIKDIENIPPPKSKALSLSTSPYKPEFQKKSKMSKVLTTMLDLKSGNLITKLNVAGVFLNKIKIGAVAFKSTIHTNAKKFKNNFKPLAGKIQGNVGKISTTANYAFLVKDFANAIRHGDTTSLAIMGSMVGVGVTSQVFQAVGNSARVASKGLVAVGKVLGVGLDVVGVAFDVVSVVSSHKCLKSSNDNRALCRLGKDGCVEEYNVCGGRDAVAETVTSYVQLGLSLVTISVTIAFPPAAPFIAIFQLLFGFAMQIYQATKQVDNFAKYFPLTDAERKQQIGKVLMGGGIDQKFLTWREMALYNAKALEQMKEFLEQNKDTFWAKIGAAYEAIPYKETIRNEDNCEKRENARCPWYAWILSVAACGIAEAVRSGIGPCEEEVTRYNYREFENNDVDLTDYRWRNFQRWSPNPNEMTENYKRFKFTQENFFCRPQGSHDGESTWDGYSYKCINAIGLKSQDPSDKLYALFHLGGGVDFAVGSAQSPNYFQVGNGYKNFKGGPHNDVFTLDGGNINGVLDGADGNDTLNFKEFGNGIVEILVENSQQYFTTQPENFGLVNLKSIEVIIGREWKKDRIYTSCENTFIDGKGGNANSPDEIYIASIGCKTTSSVAKQVNINVPPATKVTYGYSNQKGYQFQYNVINDNSHYGPMRRTISILSNHRSTQHTIFLQYLVKDLRQITYSGRANNDKHFNIQSSYLNLEISLASGSHSFIVTKDEAQFSFFEDDGNNNNHPQETFFFQFNLLNRITENVVGAVDYVNNFHIRNNYESITGGRKDNTFVFEAGGSVARIYAEGNTGTGSNKIQLGDGLVKNCNIDFQEKRIMFYESIYYIETTALHGAFQHISGRSNGAEKVTTDCYTATIDLLGTSSSYDTDEIIVPDAHCSNLSMRIKVHPGTRVTSLAKSGQYYLTVPKISTQGGSLNFNRVIEIANMIMRRARDSATYFIEFEFSIEELTTLTCTSTLENTSGSGSSNNSHTQLLLNVQAPSLNFKISFQYETTNIFLSFVNQVEIIFIPSAHNPSELLPAFKFFLSSSSSSLSKLGSVVSGGKYHSNFFIFNDTAQRDLRLVEGGRESDTFIFKQMSRVMRINSGLGGNNTIKFEVEESGEIDLDLQSKTLSWINYVHTTNLYGSFSNIISTPNLQDKLTVDCEVQLVDLKYGYKAQNPLITPMDQIIIPPLYCPQVKMFINVYPATDVKSNPFEGRYTYLISKNNYHKFDNETDINFRSHVDVTVLNTQSENQLQHIVVMEQYIEDIQSLIYDPLRKLLIVQAQYVKIDLTFETNITGKDNFVLSLNDNDAKIALTLDPDAQRLRLGDVNPQRTPVFQIDINKNESKKVSGGKLHPNYFYIQNTSSLMIQGGGKSDTFVLGKSPMAKEIDGGPAGENAIELIEELEGPVLINMVERKIQIVRLEHEIKVSGKLQHILGRLNHPDNFVANCDTKTVDLRGGSQPGSQLNNRDFMDTILIPELNCLEATSVNIQVPTLTKVTNKISSSAQFVYFISRKKEDPSTTNKMNHQRIIDLSSASPESQHIIKLVHEPKEYTSVIFDQDSSTISLKAKDLDLTVKMTISWYQNEQNTFFVVNDYTEIFLNQEPSSNRIDPVFKFNLTSSNCKSNMSITGGKSNPNIFIIRTKIASIFGGSRENTFILGLGGRVERINSKAGHNSLVFKSDEYYATNYLVKYIIDLDLTNGSVIFQVNNEQIGTELVGTFSQVTATSAGIKQVRVSCNTKYVNLLSDGFEGKSNTAREEENLEMQNWIEIPFVDSPSCDYDLTIQLSPDPKYQTIFNNGQSGIFKYIIPTTQGDYVIHRNQSLIAMDETDEEEPTFRQSFYLPVSIFDVKNVVSYKENSSVVLYFADGGSSSFTFEAIDRFNTTEAALNNPGEEDEVSAPDYLNTTEDPGTGNGSIFNETATQNLYSSFPFYFITKDGYEITVNHIGGLSAIKKLSTSELSSHREDAHEEIIVDIISAHTDLANDLGMTILIAFMNDEGITEKIIQIGGDDEMDFLINQRTVESHLVGNSIGSRNMFYIAPTENNVPVYIYLLEWFPRQSSFGYEDKDDDEDFDDDLETREQANIIVLTSFYDQRPHDVNPEEYRPTIYIPTLKQIGDDLIISCRYSNAQYDNETMESLDFLDEGNITTFIEPLEEQTIVFVNGVISSRRMYVKLYSILYKFERSLAMPDSEGNQPEDLYSWKLVPNPLPFLNSNQEVDENDGEDDEQPFQNDPEPDFPGSNEDTESEGGKRIKRNTDDASNYDEMRPAKQKDTEFITYLSYGDIMEYQMADVSLNLPQLNPQQETPDASVFTKGDSLIITNNLNKPELSHDLGTFKRMSIVLLDIKKSMKAFNFTCVFNNGDQGQVIVSHENFTESFPTVEEAEDDLDAFMLSAMYAN